MKRTTLAVCLLGLAVAASVGCHDFDIDFARGTGGDIVLYDDLYSVSVVDDLNAVAVRYYGAAYATSDGGETWI